MQFSLFILPKLGHSQAIRDPAASNTAHKSQSFLPKNCGDGLSQGAKALASSYNEPLITSEWAVEIFKRSKKS